MDTNFVNNHRQKALYAFRETIQTIGKKLSSTQSSSSIETAKMLIELAELHMLSNETAKAEVEFTNALNIINGCANEDVKERIAYVIYILKTLGGMHECMGRKKEAKAEEKEAQIWEEKLNQLNKMNKIQATYPRMVNNPVTVLDSDFVGITFA